MHKLLPYKSNPLYLEAHIFGIKKIKDNTAWSYINKQTIKFSRHSMLWLFTTVPEKLEKMSEGRKTFLLSNPDWQCSVHKFLGQLMSPRILNYIYSINLTYRYTAHHMHTCLLLAQFHRMINIKYLLTIQLRDSVLITMKEIY